MKTMYVVLCASLLCAMNVLGAGSASTNVNCGKQVQISATAKDGYHFVKWADGNTTNPRTITIQSTTQLNYQAIFEANQTNFGDDVVIDTPNPKVGDPITLTATPSDDCYQFKEWSDHNTENPRTITYDGTVPFTAVYELKTFTVTVNADDESHGNVTVTIVP